MMIVVRVRHQQHKGAAEAWKVDCAAGADCLGDFKCGQLTGRGGRIAGSAVAAFLKQFTSLTAQVVVSSGLKT